jgi:hypothetical protein
MSWTWGCFLPFASVHSIIAFRILLQPIDASADPQWPKPIGDPKGYLKKKKGFLFSISEISRGRIYTLITLKFTELLGLCHN